MLPGFVYGKSDVVLTPETSKRIAWSGDDLEGDDVVMYIIKLSGTNSVLSNMARLRVKADSQPIIDVDGPTHLPAYIKRASSGGFAEGGSDVYLHIPLYVLEAKSDEERYASAFPRGKKPCVEIECGSTAISSTPTATIYWVKRPDIKHPLYPLFFTEPLNIPASSTNGKCAFTRKGAVRHLTFDITYLTSAALLVNGEQMELFDGAAWGHRDVMEQGSANTAGHCVKMSPAIPENSVIKLASAVTTSSWAESVEVGTFAYDAAPTP
jgi:hypothetical protein